MNTNSELQAYREIVDLGLAAMHAGRLDALRQRHIEEMLARVIALNLEEDIAPSTFNQMIGFVREGAKVPPGMLISFRDMAIARGVERARQLGTTFDWTRDLEDDSIVGQSLRDQIEECLAAGDVSEHDGAAMLKALDRWDAGDQSPADVERVARAAKKFARALRKRSLKRELLTLSKAQHN